MGKKNKNKKRAEAVLQEAGREAQHAAARAKLSYFPLSWERLNYLRAAQCCLLFPPAMDSPPAAGQGLLFLISELHSSVLQAGGEGCWCSQPHAPACLQSQLPQQDSSRGAVKTSSAKGKKKKRQEIAFLLQGKQH